MAVPNFQSLMLPAVKALAGVAEMSMSELRARIAASEGLTDEDVRKMLPSGRKTVFLNRVGWVMTHLEFAGLVEKPRRGFRHLTAEGERLLADPPSRIDSNYLERYPAYAAWRNRFSKGRRIPSDDAAAAQSKDSMDTPEEALE